MGMPRRPDGVPEGWISLGEAAEWLGVSRDCMRRIVSRGYVRPRTYYRGSVAMRYAPPAEWEAGLRRWHEDYPKAQKTNAHVQHQRKEHMGVLPAVDPETARRRLQALTPRQRMMLRLYILAVMRGYNVNALNEILRRVPDDLAAELVGRRAG